MSDVWAGIVRVSSVGTRGGDSFHSDREQVEDITRAVQAIPGAELEILPPELDVSGGLSLEERPSLLAAVEGVERGEYAGIIVAYLSRLGRNVREQLRAWDRVEAAGGRVIVVRENLDTSTPAGRMMRTIMLAQAQAERELHAERFENDRRRATEAGIWKQPQTPLGYDRDPTTRHLTPNAQAADVRWAFQARLDGVKVLDIAERLEYTPGGVRALLRNRVYLGELRNGPHFNPDAHPAIIDADVFDALQTTPAPRPARRQSFTEPALLAGLIRCQACGHKMTRAMSGAAPVYLCHKHKSGGVCPRAGAITCHRIDPYVGLIADHVLRRLALDLTARTTGLDDLREALAKAERRLAAFLAAIEPDDVGPEAYATEARARRKAIDDAKTALRRAQALAPAPALGGNVPRWDDLSPAEQRAVLGGMLDAVIVRATGRGSSRPLEDRVRVIAADSGIYLPTKRGGRPMGITELTWPDPDADVVLRVPSS